jgi:hypothetical protein
VLTSPKLWFAAAAGFGWSGLAWAVGAATANDNETGKSAGGGDGVSVKDQAGLNRTNAGAVLTRDRSR